MIRHLRSRAPLAAFVAAIAFVVPVRAAGVEGPPAAFRLLPADAAFYTSMLRNREQVELVAKSKAWAKLMNLPAAKMARKMVEAQLEHPDPEFAMAVNLLKQAENQELIELLGEAVSDEVFIYGSSGWVDTTDLALQVANAVRFGPALAQINPETRDRNPSEIQARIVLQTLSQNIKLIRVPDLVIGFKVKDTKKAEAQIKRLEDLIGMVIGGAPPYVRDGFKRVKVGDSSVLNLTLPGSLIPWDDLHIKDYEDKEGEYDALLNKLKELKLSVSFGVHHGYIVLAIGHSPDHLKVIGGEGKRLNQLAEFETLGKFTDKRITSIGYVSKAWKAATMPSAADYTAMGESLSELLKAADLPAEVLKKLKKDIASVATEFGRNLPEAGASVSFSFLTDRGSEGYAYDFGTFPNGLDGSKPLTLAEHVGEHPIFWAVGRPKSDPEAYKTFARAVPGVYGHIEEALFTKLDENQKEQYESVKKVILPLVKRLDEITGTLLVPALADGQIGFVLDAKWTSAHWHTAMLATPSPKPMPEIGILLGISDQEKFLKAMKEYYALINDSLAAASELGKGQIPDIQMPAPKVVTNKERTLAYYPIPPEFGFDVQVVPTAGVSKSAFVITLSRAHTERLLRPTKLNFESGPLADMKNKPLAAASSFNFVALIDAVTPWIETGFTMAHLPPTPPGPDGDVLKQVRTVLEVLKVLRGGTSATYYEDGKLVTHSETVIRDID